jgi:hypothetical protein
MVKLTLPSVGKEVEQLDASTLQGGGQSSITSLEEGLSGFIKLNLHVPKTLLLDSSRQKICLPEICTQMFTAPLSITTKTK